MADHAHPVALHQRLDDVRVDRHAAHGLDLGTRDGLTVGDQRQRLEERPRVALRAFGPQPRDLAAELRTHLQPEPARDLAQLDRPPLVVSGDARQGLAEAVRRRPRVFVEKLRELRDRERPSGREQRRFDDVADMVFVHAIPSSSWSRSSSRSSSSSPSGSGAMVSSSTDPAATAAAAPSAGRSGTALTGGRLARRTCSGP